MVIAGMIVSLLCLIAAFASYWSEDGNMAQAIFWAILAVGMDLSVEIRQTREAVK